MIPENFVCRPLRCSLRSSLHAAVLLLVFSLAAGAASAAPDDRAMAPAGREAQALYWQGHDALKQARFDEALVQFSSLEQQLKAEEPAAVDAAIYWQAYTLRQLGRSGEARAAVQRLRREFPDSRWLQEARRLLAADRSAGEVDPLKQGEDLVEAALSGLISAPPERALPLLERVLAGNYSARSKNRALFVLSQIDDSRANQRLQALARTGPTGLREEAIGFLGMSGQTDNAAVLAEIYRDSDDRDSRRAVLRAWMIGQRSTEMAAVARTESDPKLRAEAVRLLGAMGARTELSALLKAHGSPAVQGAALEALGIAGARAELSEFAGGSGSVELRARALRGLGIAGAGEELVALYPRLDSPELRASAREALMISGHSAGLQALYAQATEAEEKRALLRMLTIAGGDSALDAIEATLDSEQGQ